MTLPVPVLDDRKFQDIVDECKRMIPRYAPEWTDHNVSDPGVTLIELFAWMTELLLYRMNQVPRRNYLKFLDMIGVSLEAPRPARAEIVFRLAAPQQAVVSIPEGTEVATVRTATQQSIVFATERALDVLVPALAHVLVSRDEFTYRDYSPALRNPNLRVPIFEEPPRPGNGFYLGYYGDLAGHMLLLHLECEIQGIGVDPRNPPLAYEYYDGNLQTWRPVRLEQDGTGGLNRTGDVILRIPITSRIRELDRRRATWIRCRITDTAPGQRPYSAAPRVLSITAQSLGASVMASHSEIISVEPLGRSDGAPGQTFEFSVTPILPRRADETLEVETETVGVFESWQEVTNFSTSGPDDPHFTCDSVTGKITLGPSIRLPSGQERQYGRIPRQGLALRFSRYRVGGGVVGNVGKNTLTSLKTSIPYIAAVDNPEPAVGGTEAETIEGAMMRGPQVVRSSPRAVTAADYERLAYEASPDVARARCVYAREQDDGLAGSVRLIIVPQMTTTDTVVPPEQLALSDRVRTTVQDYLDERRMITVRMVLGPPGYLPASVRVEVHARPRTDKARVQTAVERALYHFVHPTAGGAEGGGWPFDRALFPSDIYRLVQGVEDVDYVDKVQLVSFDADGAAHAVEDGPLTPPANTLLCSAAHQVTVR